MPVFKVGDQVLTHHHSPWFNNHRGWVIAVESGVCLLEFPYPVDGTNKLKYSNRYLTLIPREPKNAFERSLFNYLDRELHAQV